MTFYTYDYLVRQEQPLNPVKIAIIILLIVVIAFFSIKYRQNKTLIKYRDLSIIFIFVGLFLTFVQLNQINDIRNLQGQSRSMIKIMNKIAQHNHSATHDLQINSATINTNMIIRDTHDNTYYQILMDSNQQGYLIEKMQIDTVNTKIEVVGQK